jgi:hypothetical protein
MLRVTSSFKFNSLTKRANTIAMPMTLSYRGGERFKSSSTIVIPQNHQSITNFNKHLPTCCVEKLHPGE